VVAQCAYCKTETFLYDGDVPICLECAKGRDARHDSQETERHVRGILIQEVVESTARAHAASEAFSAIMADVPSALPHPDGTQRIHHVSGELSAAREKMMRAHTRLNDFLTNGIIPEDLKQGGGPSGA
jgi:hypothetical protein